MNWLFDLMDLPDNLQRALGICRSIRGLSALIMAGVLFFLCWLMWPALWYFDIESTAVWTDQAIQAMGATLSSGAPLMDTYTSNAGWFVTGFTFLPTLIELFTARFAQGGIKVASALVIFFSTFDLVTDWPRVNEFINALGVEGPMGLALKIPLLILASFGFQSLFIIFLVCGFALLLQARQDRAVGRMAPAD
jgi:hypothetical protein